MKCTGHFIGLSVVFFGGMKSNQSLRFLPIEPGLECDYVNFSFFYFSNNLICFRHSPGSTFNPCC